MTYAYMTVPFVGSSDDNLDPSQVAEQLKSLMNKYSAMGWDFYQINSVNIEVRPGCISGLFGARSYDKRFDMLIFRQVSKNNVASVGEHFPVVTKTIKPAQPKNPNAKCPSCDSLITIDTKQCWKCQAVFGVGSSWKPIPI